MKRIVLAVCVVVAVVGAFLVGGNHRPDVAIAAVSPPGDSGVVVDGLGKTTGTPDVLRVILGLSLKRADVSTAMSAANAGQARLRNALTKAGVAAKDVQTSEVRVHRSYDNKGASNGYQVTETLMAKLRDLKKAGQAISSAVAAGGPEATVQGVSFSLENNDALLGQARDLAYADAKQKAQRYANLSGRQLGEVQRVTESSSTPFESARGFSAATGGAALSDVPIDPGTAEVSVSVTVRWALRS